MKFRGRLPTLTPEGVRTHAVRSLRSVAIRWGVSDSAMQGYKRKLAQAVKEFMGEDVLALVAQVPAWKSNLVALRERQVGRAFQG